MSGKRTPSHKLSAFAITAAGAAIAVAVAAGASTSATAVSPTTGHATTATSAQLTTAGASRPQGALVLDAYTRPAFYQGPGSFEGCVISHESSGNPHAVNPASGAGGLYGFMPSTWASIGFSGLPENAPVATQHAAFQRLYATQGTTPWRGDGCE